MSKYSTKEFEEVRIVHSSYSVGIVKSVMKAWQKEYKVLIHIESNQEEEMNRCFSSAYIFLYFRMTSWPME